MSYTLLHCFDCDYNTVANKAKKIKETGYDGIQIGPVQYCKGLRALLIRIGIKTERCR